MKPTDRARRPVAPLLALGLLALAGAGSAAPGPLAAPHFAPTTPLSVFSECSEDLPHDQSAAVYRICTPPPWWVDNGELVIWAHGYVDFTQPIEIPEDQLCFTDDLCMNDVVNFLGYNFATTSYSVNGLAVLPGMDDVAELVDLYTAYTGEEPLRVYLIGASEGGLITALSLEQRPEIFDGGLAMCGPIGDFVYQTNYFGHFRAAFDFYFPGLIPGDPTDIPPELIDNWDTYYPEQVEPVVFADENRPLLFDLLAAAAAPVDRLAFEESARTTVGDLAWYSVFATNDAREKLGGQPFDNRKRLYTRTDDDYALNLGVERIAADEVAVEEMQANYQTTGELTHPLVTLHTTLDQQVPHWHELAYLKKTHASGSWPDRHLLYPSSVGYGHCLFPMQDVLGAFSALVEMVSGAPLPASRLEAALAASPEEVRLHDVR